MSLLVLFGFICIGKSASPRKILLNAYENICMQAKKQQSGFFDYGRLERYLQVNGASYHYGNWINPVNYLALCGSCGMVILAIGSMWGFLPGLFLGFLGLWLPGMLLEHMNKRDNEKMMAELDMIYSALSIQIRAGVYITDALAECYGSVSQERLRDALQNLSGDIVMKADLDGALERFQGRFNNRYIDSLCITVLQAMESGQAVELLGDIAEQIKDMELILQHKKKEKLNRSVTFYQLGIFALILVLVLYACVVHLFSADLFF
jgi:Flp pilus assembly protein TadB